MLLLKNWYFVLLIKNNKHIANSFTNLNNNKSINIYKKLKKIINTPDKTK